MQPYKLCDPIVLRINLARSPKGAMHTRTRGIKFAWVYHKLLSKTGGSEAISASSSIFRSNNQRLPHCYGETICTSFTVSRGLSIWKSRMDLYCRCITSLKAPEVPGDEDSSPKSLMPIIPWRWMILVPISCKGFSPAGGHLHATVRGGKLQAAVLSTPSSRHPWTPRTGTESLHE